ncbi:MAG TPA: hypothetical protein VIJ92_09955, partial [Ginsengibacter sp.]
MKHLKTSIMKFRFALYIAMLITLFSNCRKNDFHPPVNANYPADVANSWMQLHIALTKTTAGYNSVVADRSFGYAGITLYESLVPSITGAKDLLSQIGGSPVTPDKNKDQYFWPASLNAAMAMLTRDLFESTSDANKATIDSLEAAYNLKFQSQADAQRIQNAIDYGHNVATSIYNWSITDGGDQAYKHVVDPTYIPKVGPGLW